MIQSTTTTTKSIHSAFYEIERDGKTKEINDSNITSEDIAQKRAIAEFLENGYDKQTVEFTTFFSPLKINNIIKISVPELRVPQDLSKDRFIIKNIKHSFGSGYMKTKIKAIRYD